MSNELQTIMEDSIDRLVSDFNNPLNDNPCDHVEFLDRLIKLGIVTENEQATRAVDHMGVNQEKIGELLSKVDPFRLKDLLSFIEGASGVVITDHRVKRVLQ